VIGAGFALAPFLAINLAPGVATLIALLGVGCGVSILRALWRIPPSLEAVRRAITAHETQAAFK
jgi:hypothetical protein